MKDFFKSLNNFISSYFGSLMFRARLLPQPQKTQIKPSMPVKITAESVLMSDVIIEGHLHCDENLMIYGHFKGSISAQNNIVEVGPNGRVFANISANKVIIAGAVKGDISAENRVILAETGRLKGNIKAAGVDLENGAKFKGIIEMDPQQAQVIEVQTQVRPEIESLVEPT